MRDTVRVTVDCACGEDVTLEAQFTVHPAVPASWDDPGHGAHTELWGDDVACPCGAWITIEGNRAALEYAVHEYLEALAP